MNIDNIKSKRIVSTEESTSKQPLPEGVNSFSQEFENLQQDNKDQPSEENQQNDPKAKKQIEGNKVINNIQELANQNLTNGIIKLNCIKSKKLSDKFDSPIKLDASILSINDIDLFQKLSDGTEICVSNINPQAFEVNLLINGENKLTSYKSVEISQTLFELIDHAYNTKRPVRLDFDKDVSVILRIDNSGKLMAEFIPGDKAMEFILKNALPDLKNKFDEENIPYKQLSYRDHNDKQNKRDNNKKEAEEDE